MNDTLLLTIMSEEAPPPDGPVESTDVPTVETGSIDKAVKTSESAASRYARKAAYALYMLYMTYSLNWWIQCLPDACSDKDANLTIIWTVVHFVALAVAASPLLEDRWFDHGRFYFVYQAAVIGSILSSCKPPSHPLELSTRLLISSLFYNNSVHTLDNDYTRAGSYSVFKLNARERIYRSLGVQEESLDWIRHRRSKFGYLDAQNSSFELQNRMRNKRSSAVRDELFIKAEEGKNGES
ncbi:hypothetical protein CPB85DRAFT_1558947 [Mucidula mucida]|nr:hypothetical protein CPB85DRAFT_1558947 [Mucidula mucida]